MEAFESPRFGNSSAVREMEAEIRELRAELKDLASRHSAAQDDARRVGLRLEACERGGPGERVDSVERCLREDVARRWQDHEARHVALNELLAESDGAALSEIANERNARKAAIAGLEASLSEQVDRLRRDIQASIAEQGDRLRQDIQVALCDQLRAAQSEQESSYGRELASLEARVQDSLCEQITSVQMENQAGHLALRALLDQHSSAQDARFQDVSSVQSEQHAACQRALEMAKARFEERMGAQDCEDSAGRCTKMCEQLASQRAGIFADHRDRLMTTFDALRSGATVGVNDGCAADLETSKCTVASNAAERLASRGDPEDTQQDLRERTDDCLMKAIVEHRDSLLSSLDTLQCSVQTDVGQIWPIVRDLLSEHVSAHDAKHADLLDQFLQDKSVREQQTRSMRAALEDLELKIGHASSEFSSTEFNISTPRVRPAQGPHQFLARDYDSRLAQEKREREKQAELLHAAIEGIDTRLNDMGGAAYHDQSGSACDWGVNLRCTVQEHADSLRALESNLEAETRNLRCSFKDLQADSLKAIDSMVEVETRNLRCSFEDFQHVLHTRMEERAACVNDTLSKQAYALDELRSDCKDRLAQASAAQTVQHSSLQAAVRSLEEKDRLSRETASLRFQQDMEGSVSTLPPSQDALAVAAGRLAERQESSLKEQHASLEAVLERGLERTRSDAASLCASLGARTDDLQRRFLEERSAREARCADLQAAIRHTDAELQAEIARVADEQRAGLAALRHRLAAHQPSEASTVDTEALDEIRSVLEGRLDAECHAREAAHRFLQNSLMTMETQLHERISRRSRPAKSTSSRLLPECSDAIASTASRTLSNTAYSQHCGPGAARLLAVDPFATAGFGGQG